MDKVTKTNTKGRQRQRLLKRIILHIEWRSWMTIFSVNSYFSMHEEKETLLATGFVQHSIFKSTSFRNISFKLLQTWLQGVAGTWNHSGPSTRNANPVNNKSSSTADRTNNLSLLLLCLTNNLSMKTFSSYFLTPLNFIPTLTLGMNYFSKVYCLA